MCPTLNKTLVQFINLEHYSHYISTKTKFDNACASRECLGFVDRNVLTIFGGKITGIFEAELVLADFLERREKQ